jgi:hypothetical protein
VALEPEKARLKVRTEHYIVDELNRRMPELMARARSATWDCAAPGGCSLKRADLLYILEDRYIQVEVDERGHASYPCYDEDTRLEIIAADVGLPGMVLRLNPDEAACFGPKRLSNGETVVQIRNRAALDALMDETCQAISTYLSAPPPPTLVGVSAGDAHPAVGREGSLLNPLRQMIRRRERPVLDRGGGGCWT